MKLCCLLFSVLFAVTLRAENITVHVVGCTYATNYRYTKQRSAKELSLVSGSTVLDALAHAGGCADAAFLTGIKLTRKTKGAPAMYMIDATKALKTPDNAFTLADGDIVFVPEIVEGYPPPHYFNGLLFQWAFLKAKQQPLPENWTDLVENMTPRGQEKRLIVPPAAKS